MSRIGKKPIKVPSGVKVDYTHPNLEVSGKLGKLNWKLPMSVELKMDGDTINVVNTSEDPELRALHGLNRTLVANMVHGVAEGYEKSLELKGVGYRAAAKGQILNLQLGFSHPVDFQLPEGVKAKVDANTKITLSGPDKAIIGLTAANIRKIRPPEPYKGKGVRYLGEHIKLKAGKAAGGGK